MTQANLTASSAPSSDPPLRDPAGLIGLAIRVGRLFFRTRNVVFPLVFLALAILSKPVLWDGSLASDLTLDMAGIMVALAGQSLRVLVIGLAYIKRGGKKKQVYADTLVVDGVFAHCRNPLYVGNILTLIGLTMIHNSPWMYAVALPFFIGVYLCIVLAEEEYLKRRFGDVYMEYCRSVHRFILNPRGLGATLRGARFDWRKVIRKEYGTPFAWASAALGMIGWEAVIHQGLHGSRARIDVLIVIWLVLALLYVTARVLKKRRLLGTD